MGGTKPSACWRHSGLGLPSQGRQIQLQTRLRSMCRRATSTMCGLGWATVTPPLCHGCRGAMRAGQIWAHDD
ncbi:hypothetical protein CKJ67_09255 [Mycobacterium intracellulare]|nr:hypothetical protein CKJ67_09255 [Mycobacterium intracellulare]PBA21796.1 hypothetical protein CKJ68_09315 [Mycobacterium intracellulare]